MNIANRFRLLSCLFLYLLGVACLPGAYAAPSLKEGFDWSLPDYAKDSENGFMLGDDGFVPVVWKLSEPQKGDYDFSLLQQHLDTTEGKLVIRLEVNSQCHAPEWTNIPYLNNKSLQFWEPEYVEQLSGFVTEFARRFKSNPRIAGVQLGVADGEYYQDGDSRSDCPAGNDFNSLVFDHGREGWGELWVDTGRGEHTASIENGLTPALFESSLIDIIDMYAKAFDGEAGKLAMVNFDAFGVDEFDAKLGTVADYAISQGIGNRGGQIESWMRYTNKQVGVGMASGNNVDGSCSMIYDENFADTVVANRYWGDENEFYGAGDFIVAANGPIENQPYRFYVSSMRALQLRRKQLVMSDAGNAYLNSINEDYEYSSIADNASGTESTLTTKYRPGNLLGYMEKTLGRTRTDTPDAFVVLGERTIDTDNRLYPVSYKQDDTEEACLIEGKRLGYTRVNEFGRWLSVVSPTTADTSMRKDIADWGQVVNAKRDNEQYELYARKSDRMLFDINDQLIAERCSSDCNIEVKVVFKDDREMTLNVAHANGISEALTTVGDGQIKTATFPVSGSFVNALDSADFSLQATDGSEISVLMARVNFTVDIAADEIVPQVPVGISPASTKPLIKATFSWSPVPGATEYQVSFNNSGDYYGGEYMSAALLGCSTGTCSYTAEGLVPGPGVWWVRAKNPAGESDWSNELPFVIEGLVTPKIVGPVDTTSKADATFTWKPVEGATEYRLSFANNGGYDGGVYKSAEALGCETGICSLSVGDLKSGQSSWWVRARSDAHESAWSRTGLFMVDAPASLTPEKPVLLAAKADEMTGSVVFNWKPVEGAEDYLLSFNNEGKYELDSYRSADELGCKTGTCSITLDSLALGNTDWWVQAKNKFGESDWSNAGSVVLEPRKMAQE